MSDEIETILRTALLESERLFAEWQAKVREADELVRKIIAVQSDALFAVKDERSREAYAAMGDEA